MVLGHSAHALLLLPPKEENLISTDALSAFSLPVKDDSLQFRSLAEAIPQVVWTAEPDGGLDFTNKRWHDYSGMTAESSRGWGWADAVHPVDLPNASKLWLGCIASGATYEVEFRLKRIDGTFRWHLTRAVPVKDDDGCIVKWFGTCTDIDDQKRAAELLEDRVQSRTADLKKAHEELQQMAYALSHELQAPLLKIGSDLGLLRVRYTGRLGDDADEFMHGAVNNAASVQNMLDGLWIYARIDRANLATKMCSCAEILGKVLIRLEPLIQEKKAKIVCDKLPTIRANEVQLEYMFQQLLENALKHCGSDKVVIRCTAR